MRRRPLAGGRRFPSAQLISTVLVAVIVLSACSASQGQSGPPGLGPGAPVVGTCRVLMARDILPATNNTPTVPCSKPHTGVVIAVGGFPPAEVTNANVSSGKLGNDALRRCTSEWKRFVGGGVTNQHISLVGLAYYLPSKTQLTDGARWYRCDLVVGGQGGLPLQPLPSGNLKGILDGTVPDQLLACRTAADFSSGQEVPCSRDHVLRAVGTAPLPDQPTYPGADALRAASAKGCATVIKQWLHGRVDGGESYQWPDQTGWEVLHDRAATCWTVTTS